MTKYNVTKKKTFSYYNDSNLIVLNFSKYKDVWNHSFIII